MGKLAFLMPGQGSQKVGMGADVLAEAPDNLERYFALAEEASGKPIKQLCLDGPIEELTSTDVAQPALFCVALAMADLAFAAGLKPDFAAGHSLGEYTAADGRGRAVGRGRDPARVRARRADGGGAGRGPGRHGGDPRHVVRARCRSCATRSTAASRPANFNTPSQIVVSAATWTRSTRWSRPRPDAGADRAIKLTGRRRLPLGGDGPGAREDGRADGGRDVLRPGDPDRLQRLGRAVTTADGIREALLAQIASPVRWVECVETLAGEGVDTWLELGPGRTLIGLVRQIKDDQDVTAADSPKKLARFVEQH